MRGIGYIDIRQEGVGGYLRPVLRELPELPGAVRRVPLRPGGSAVGGVPRRLQGMRCGEGHHPLLRVRGFPCDRSRRFSADEWPHHGVVLENIERQREVGVDAWLEEQEQRHRCPSCGAMTTWARESCPKCGRPLEGMRY